MAGSAGNMEVASSAKWQHRIYRIRSAVYGSYQRGFPGFKRFIEDLIVIADDERCLRGVGDSFKEIFLGSIEILVLVEDKKPMFI
jgi:hypothetical protein